MILDGLGKCLFVNWFDFGRLLSLSLRISLLMDSEILFYFCLMPTNAKKVYN